MASGIKVVVVGAGFGGLSAAIECHLKGHHVSIYEQSPSLKPLGDIISFGPNAGRIFARWGVDGDVAAKMRALSIDLTDYGFNIRKFDTGAVMLNQRTPPADPTAPNFNGHRGELHAVVYEYATQGLGIPVHLGQKIRTYFEEGESAGIVLQNGNRVAADLVIASDGVRSKARKSVLGYDDKPKSSGYAIWRAWFPNDDMLADPETAPFCANGDTFNGWIGPDMHLLFSTLKGGRDCCWVLTHRDEHDIDESWSFPGKLDEVLAALEGWDPMCARVVAKTPPEVLVDWKLVYRDPLPTWASPAARILLLGDAAHPFLPTSVQGAAQAVEDGASIAACLRRCGGGGGVPLAVRVHERLRYERVRATQKTGETTRDMWHKTDWEKVAKDPGSIALPRLDWIFGHDAEAYADEMFDEVARQIQNGEANGGKEAAKI